MKGWKTKYHEIYWLSIFSFPLRYNKGVRKKREGKVHFGTFCDSLNQRKCIRSKRKTTLFMIKFRIIIEVDIILHSSEIYTLYLYNKQRLHKKSTKPYFLQSTLRMSNLIKIYVWFVMIEENVQLDFLYIFNNT